MDVAYLFARAEPLKWDYKTYSYYFGFKYGFGAFVLLVAMPFLHRLGVQDSTLAIVGIFSRMAALILYGLSVNIYMAFSGITFQTNNSKVIRYACRRIHFIDLFSFLSSYSICILSMLLHPI